MLKDRHNPNCTHYLTQRGCLILLSRYHLRRFKNLTFSHFGIFLLFLGKTKLVIQKRHNKHWLIIPCNAAIRQFDTPLPLFAEQPLSCSERLEFDTPIARDDDYDDF